MSGADLQEALDKIRRYSRVRDRETEREPRTFTLTDDEGLALLEWLEPLVPSLGK